MCLDRKNANFLVKVDEVDTTGPPSAPVTLETVETPEAVLINLTDEAAAVKETDHEEVPPASVTVPSIPPPPTKTRQFRLAAIDNGLAFPFKHPGEIRSCEFTARPRAFRSLLLGRLLQVLRRPALLQGGHSAPSARAGRRGQGQGALRTAPSPLQRECGRLKSVRVQKDRRFRKKKTIEAQLSVFRGQLLNLLDALKNNKTPADLELVGGGCEGGASGRCGRST